MRTRVTPNPVAALRHAAMLAVVLVGIWSILAATTHPRNPGSKALGAAGDVSIAIALPGAVSMCQTERRPSRDGAMMGKTRL